MRRLIRSLPFCSVAIALALSAQTSRAQAVDAAASLPPAPAAVFAPAAAPLPAMLVPPANAAAALDEARSARIRVREATLERRRSGWKYPLIGAGVGALVGAGVATYVMLQSDEWLAPPFHIVTVPAGAVLGLALGGVANLIAPR